MMVVETVLRFGVGIDVFINRRKIAVDYHFAVFQLTRQIVSHRQFYLVQNKRGVKRQEYRENRDFYRFVRNSDFYPHTITIYYNSYPILSVEISVKTKSDFNNAYLTGVINKPTHAGKYIRMPERTLQNV